MRLNRKKAVIWSLLLILLISFSSPLYLLAESEDLLAESEINVPASPEESGINVPASPEESEVSQVENGEASSPTENLFPTTFQDLGEKLEEKVYEEDYVQVSEETSTSEANDSTELVILDELLESSVENTQLMDPQVEALESNDEVYKGIESNSEQSSSRQVMSGGNSYPLTVKIYKGADASGNPIYDDKTFASPDEPLGFGINGGRSNWTYKTYRGLFFAWTTENLSGETTVPAGTKVYRDIEPIGSIPNVQDGTILYPIMTSEGGLIALVTMLENSNNTGHLNIARYNEPGEVLLDATIKQNETNWASQDINSPTGEVDITRDVTAYYDQDEDKYKVQAISDFTYSDLRVPFAVIENPLGTIRAATGVTDFSGPKPLNYSYEDLIVKLDPRTTVADQQNDWKFTSSTFMVAAVLDENHNPLPMTYLNPPGHDSLETSFSFDNSSNPKSHTFIIRTVVRNDVGNGTYRNDRGPNNNILSATGADVARPMTLHSGSPDNITISKKMAKDLALDKEDRLDYHGAIEGSMSFNKSQYPFPFNMFVPNNADIAYTDARNHVYIDFAPAMLKFDKNSKDLGDNEEQNKGYSIFALNGDLDNDDFDEDTQPNIDPEKSGQAFSREYKKDHELIIDGKYYYFKGWNTKKDGTGTFVDGNTKINFNMFNNTPTKVEPADIILYGIWGKQDVMVSKLWDDNDNKDNKRPQNITVILKGDNGYENEAELDAQKDWKYTFDAVQQFDDNGKEIVYSIEEESIDKYSAVISEGELHDSGVSNKLLEFTIKNSYNPEPLETTAPVESEKPIVFIKPSLPLESKIVYVESTQEPVHPAVTKETKVIETTRYPLLPKTGDNREVSLSLSLILIASAGLLYIVKREIQ